MPNRHRSPVLLFDLDAITWSITAIAEVATQRHKHGRSLLRAGQLRLVYSAQMLVSLEKCKSQLMVLRVAPPYCTLSSSVLRRELWTIESIRRALCITRDS